MILLVHYNLQDHIPNYTALHVISPHQLFQNQKKVKDVHGLFLTPLNDLKLFLLLYQELLYFPQLFLKNFPLFSKETPELLSIEKSLTCISYKIESKGFSIDGFFHFPIP